MKTPISYYGGKQRIASKIVPYILAIPYTVYAEPFAGGLSVLYAKGKIDRGNKGHYREAINDKNKQLITFWRVAREHPEELTRWINLTPYSQEECHEAQKIYDNPSEYNNLKVAWATYIQCNMSFSHQIGAGWSVSVNGRDNSGSKWVNRADRLPECFERLRDVHIGCEDAIRFIKRWDAPQTLFYCDPPYPNSHQGHYVGYTLDDWANLCDALDSCQGSYILSNYHQDIQPKSAQKCVEIEAVMSASNSAKQTQDINKKRIEKLWICDRSKTIRSDLQKIAKDEWRKQGTLF